METREEPFLSGKRQIFISFSGIDGAGKTTQIDKIIEWLRSEGLRVRLLRFWDDVAVLRRFREKTGHALFKGEKGVGSPDKPVDRRDKNVQSWYMLPVRMLLGSLDAVGLWVVMAKLKWRSGDQVIIFDRYLYDQFANLDLDKAVNRAYVNLALQFAPRPDIAYVLDADPVEARARKPEYPIDFLLINRARYLAISKIAGMKVIHAGTPEEVGKNIRNELLSMLSSFPDFTTTNCLTSK